MQVFTAVMVDYGRIAAHAGPDVIVAPTKEVLEYRMRVYILEHYWHHNIISADGEPVENLTDDAVLSMDLDELGLLLCPVCSDSFDWRITEVEM